MPPKHVLLPATLLLLGMTGTAEAACRENPKDCSYFAGILENDKPAGRDQYYTSSFLFAWSSPAFEPPSWLSPVTGPAGLLVAEDDLRWGLSFGQNMYTPRNTGARIPDGRDRPYAAWLYGSLSLISSGETQLSSVELQLGVVGPAALGRQVQNTMHDIVGVRRSRGWENQIKDEFGANLILTRQLRYNWATGIDGLSIGVVPTFAASLGNVNTSAGVGAALRIGNALEVDFGPPRVRPVSGGSVFYERPISDGFGWYVFAGLEGRVVARDISLDGNTWRDSRSVNREWLVGDASAGVALMYDGWRLAGTYIIRSREFEGQREAARYASFSIARQF
jgi:hypothetical protein